MKTLAPCQPGPPVNGVPVVYDKLPPHFARRIRATFRDVPELRDGASPRVVCGWAFGRTVRMITFDHWGRIGNSLILEPYLYHGDDLSKLRWVADAIGCDMEVSSESEWNPPYTVRITLTPRPDWTPPAKGDKLVHPCPDGSY